MALDVPMLFEIRQTGADTSAGGFTRGGLIAAPSAPSVSNITTGGSVAANTYYFVYTYTDAWGDTVISPQSSTTTTGTTSTITATSPSAQTGAKTWSCFVGTTSGGPYFPQGTALTIGSNRSITTTPPTSGTQPRGVDYSVQDSPQISVADGVANGTTTFTSATAAFTGSHVGNLIRVGSANWRRIVSVTNATTVVLDATVTTATSLPVVVGGAFATPGIIGAVLPATWSAVALKYSATPYTMSASANVSGGNLNNVSATQWFGYNATRTIYNTDALRPTVKPSANSVSMFQNLSQTVFNNINITNPDSKTGCTAINADSSHITNCKINGLATAFSASNFCVIEFCDLSATGTVASTSYSTWMFCDIHDGAGLQLAIAGTVGFCNFYNITATQYAIDLANNASRVFNCNIYNCSYNSSSVTAILVTAPGCTVSNCVIENVNPAAQTGYAFGGTATATVTYNVNFINCFTYNIKTAQADPSTVAPANLYGVTALSASPFTNPGSGDFSPNSTAGGGAVTRTASLPTTFPAGTTTNALDAGAVQHTASGGGGGGPVIGCGFIRGTGVAA